MQVTVRRDASHEAIFRDERFEDLVEATGEHEELMQFVGAVVRRCTDRRVLAKSAMSLDGRIVQPRRRARAQQIVNGLDALYAMFDPGNVRGCVIEAMVISRLRLRYSMSLLEDNVFVTVTDGGKDYTTSTSVDAFGWDGEARRGEAHDCKAKASECDAAWLNELLDNLLACDIRVGVATATSGGNAKHVLRDAGVRRIERLAVLGPEDWWGRVPLQSL